MTQEWKKELFQNLYERLMKVTADNVLGQTPAGEYFLKTILAASAGSQDSVLIQAAPWQAREDVLLMELYVQLAEEVKPEAETQFREAIDELNSFLPIGALGISPRDGSVYLRDCFKLLTDRTPEEAAADAWVDYEMMMEEVGAAYPGLKAIWTGEKTFAQAVEAGLLKKYS